jgi:hypothetical protein
MHFRARSYDPRTGRFVQQDPVLRNRLLEHYSYAFNNPLRWLDPLGLQGQDEQERRRQEVLVAAEKEAEAIRAAIRARQNLIREQSNFATMLLWKLGGDVLTDMSELYWEVAVAEGRAEAAQKAYARAMGGTSGIVVRLAAEGSLLNPASRVLTGRSVTDPEQVGLNERSFDLFTIVTAYGILRVQRTLDPSRVNISSERAASDSVQSDFYLRASSSDKAVNRFLATRPVVGAGTSVRLEARVSSDTMQRLANNYEQEVALIYRSGPGKGGGGGYYELWVGSKTEVDIPVGPDVIWIGHTHPGGRVGPSIMDIDALRRLRAAGSPQNRSGVWSKGGSGPFWFREDTPVVPGK